MKHFNQIAAAILFLLSITFTYSQKMWLTGVHANSQISYYKDGAPSFVDVVWAGGSPKNGDVVVQGQFKTDNRGNYYFEIENSANSTDLKNGVFSQNTSSSCYIQGLLTGYLTNSNNQRTVVASFEHLDVGQNVITTNAAWGTSYCNGREISVYYILNIKEVQGARVVEQNFYNNDNNYSSNAPSMKTTTITGKIISRNETGYMTLNVPNSATFRTSDGRTIEISSEKPINSNGQVTLEGYTKLTYWDGVMKTSDVFYVTKVR